MCICIIPVRIQEQTVCHSYCTRFEFRVFSSLLTFCKIIEKHSIFNVSPVQVLCKQGWHLLFTSHSDFLKMLKNRIKIGQYRLHLYCPRFLVGVTGFVFTVFCCFFSKLKTVKTPLLKPFLHFLSSFCFCVILVEFCLNV